MIAQTLSTLVSVRCKCSDDLNVEGGKFYLTCECDCVLCGSGLMSLHNWKLPPGLSGQCTAALNWLGALQPTPVFRWIHVFGLEGPQFDVPWFIFLSKAFSFVSPGFHTVPYFCVPRVSHWARDLEWGSALTRAGRGPSLFAKVLPLVLLFLQDETKTNTKIRNQRQGAIPLCQGSTCPCPKNAENIFGGNLLADFGGTPGVLLPPIPLYGKKSLP